MKIEQNIDKWTWFTVQATRRRRFEEGLRIHHIYLASIYIFIRFESKKTSVIRCAASTGKWHAAIWTFGYFTIQPFKRFGFILQIVVFWQF